MPILFLDESGYTGQDFLNTAQPVFALATISYPEAVCRELKETFFNRVQSAELKHSALRTPSRRRLVLEFLSELAKKPESVKVLIAHKRYVLTTKLVDIIIESTAFEAGINLYKNDVVVALSNFLFFALPALQGEDFFENLLRRFQEMMRQLDQASYDRFFEFVFSQEYPEQLSFLLNIFQAAYSTIGYELVNRFKTESDQLNLPATPLDIGLTSTIYLINQWRPDIANSITLIHDASSRMARERHMWDALANPNLPAAEFRQADRQWAFPLNVKEIYLENSRDWVGLQFADIIVGATAYFGKWIIDGRPDDEYGRTLEEIIPQFLASGVWPTLDIDAEADSRTDNGGTASLDYIAQVLLRMRKPTN